VNALLAAFALVSLVGFYFGFGWYGSHVYKLWSTPEYGGRKYGGDFVRACLTTFLLFAAAYLADKAEVSKDARAFSFLASAVFFWVGWHARMRSLRKREVD
jgi:hypothetical protein